MRSLVDENILVTGGAGFIGSNLIDSLLLEDVNSIIAIDNYFLGDDLNLFNAYKSDKFKIYKDDAENFEILEYIIKENNISVVFNCATKALNYSFVNPRNAFDTNVKIILNLLELQRRCFFNTLCHFSTSEVYGKAIYEPLDEIHPKTPLTTYAGGKASADYALETYFQMFGLDSFIVRPFNNYGPRQNYKGYMAGVIPITIYRILNGLDLEIHGTGEQSRDFIFVKDTIRSVIELFKVMPSGESVNISTDNQIKIGDLVRLIAKEMDYKGRIINRIQRDADVSCHIGCNKKIKSLIDFSLVPFYLGLKETIDWYVKAMQKS